MAQQHEHGADRVYVIPQGLLHGEAARLAVRQGLALPLAGRRLAFTCGWLVHHCGRTQERSRRLLHVDELRRKAEDHPALARWLQQLGRQRPPFAGLPLDVPRVMGIINVTPDSFSDGGLHGDARAAIEHGLRLAEAGADVLDVGGESTRPGAAEVSEEEEMERVLPVVEALAAQGCVVSVDTRKSAVMRAAVKAGARIVNDVSALSFDPQARATVAELEVPVILMHMRGTPDTMMQHAAYDDVALEVFDELEAAVLAAETAGISRQDMMIDPGIGFAKNTADNLALLRHLALLHGLGMGVLYAASRKRFIGEITGVAKAGERLAGSLAVAELAWLAGAQMVRVHDVAQTVQVKRMLQAVLEEG